MVASEFGQQAAPRRVGRIVFLILSLASAAAGLVMAGLCLFAGQLYDEYPGWHEGTLLVLALFCSAPLLLLQLLLAIIVVLLRLRISPGERRTGFYGAALLLSWSGFAVLLASTAWPTKLLVESEIRQSNLRKEADATENTITQAVECGDVERCRALLKSRGGPSVFNDEFGTSLVIMAVKRQDRAMVEMLLERCPPRAFAIGYPRRAGPLHYAAASGNVEIGALLIDKGANVNEGDGDYKTPLTYARENGRSAMADFLVSKGGVPEDRTSRVLDAAVKGDGASVRQLVEQGVDPNSAHEWGFGLLHYVAGEGDIVTAEVLIRKGANVNAGDDNGMTPMHIAAQRNQPEMIRFLFSKGADLSGRSLEGLTPLGFAREGGHKEAVRTLEELESRKQSF